MDDTLFTYKAVLWFGVLCGALAFLAGYHAARSDNMMTPPTVYEDGSVVFVVDGIERIGCLNGYPCGEVAP